MKFLLSAAVALLIFGCDIVGTVIDISGTETGVRNMHVSGTGTMRIITAGTTVLAPLESFESIMFFPEEARIVNGEFCFPADITMRDGTRMAARDRTHDNAPLTFVSVHQTLTGTSRRGTFSANLTGVTKITFLH